MLLEEAVMKNHRKGVETLLQFENDDLLGGIPRFVSFFVNKWHYANIYDVCFTRKYCHDVHFTSSNFYDAQFTSTYCLCRPIHDKLIVIATTLRATSLMASKSLVTSCYGVQITSNSCPIWKQLLVWGSIYETLIVMTSRSRSVAQNDFLICCLSLGYKQKVQSLSFFVISLQAKGSIPLIFCY